MAMIWTGMAAAAFILFFVYDWNSIHWRNSVIQKFFAMGSILLVCSAAGVLVTEKNRFLWGDRKLTVILFLFIVNVILLIYTLFFALPFEETYQKASQKRSAYTGKIYALCRHPGVLWLGGVQIILVCWKESAAVICYALLVTVCNVCYVVYQDLVIFPETFDNYREYQKQTPFLIPNPKSIRACLKDYHNKGKKK